MSETDGENSRIHLLFYHYAGIPDVPEGLTAVADTTYIQLTWSPPSQYHGPITHYQVAYSSDASSSVTVANTSTPILIVRGLKPENEYSFQVRAVTTAGAGDYSSPITVTTTTLCKFFNCFEI